MGPGRANLFVRERDPLIDLLRGFCLSIMTIDHLPHTVVEKLTWQTFGFVSAAEGFVFLSGLVTGMVYGRAAESVSFSAVLRKAYRRVRTIYLSNALYVTCIILAALAGFNALGTGYVAGWQLWLKAMLFMATPAESGILRLYFLLFLAIPAIILALNRNRFFYVVIISTLLWALAAFGLGMSAIRQTHGFDVVSWQVLFVAGLAFGLPRSYIRMRLPSSNSWMVTASVLVCGFFAVRHLPTLIAPLSSYFQWLSDWRRTLAVGRLVNFAALAYVVFRMRRHISKLSGTFIGHFLVFLGRHSLPVFMWSICVSTICVAMERSWTKESPLVQATLELFVVTSCVVPAWLHLQWQELRPKLQPREMVFRTMEQKLH
jgi:hypothetical protein